jgi:hypothetical protein
MEGYLWLIWVKLAGALWTIGGKLGSSLIFYFVAINDDRKSDIWGRLYQRWISYPVDKSYPMDKSPIQWIAICRIKMRCTKHG